MKRVCFTDIKISGIMVIHNFRTVDEIGYLLLLMVVKGVQGITKS